MDDAVARESRVEVAKQLSWLTAQDEASLDTVTVVTSTSHS